MRKGLSLPLSLTASISITLLYVKFVPRGSVSSELIGWLIYVIPAWTAYMVTRGGALAVLGLMSLESASLPIPSEVILPLSGFLMSQGKMELIPLLIAVIAGTFIGAVSDYVVGYVFGLEVLERKRLVGAQQLQAATNWFKRYGIYAVFLSRLIPGMRSIISFPAGAFKMNVLAFVTATEAGSIVYSSAMIYIGYIFGQHWEAIVSALNGILVPSGVFAVSLAVTYVVFRALGFN